MMRLNKLSLVLHFCIILCALYVFYLRFIRFLLADNETIAIALLNPSQLPIAQPVLFSFLMLVVLSIFFLLLKTKPSSNSVFRSMKGLYGYCLILLCLQLTIVLTNEYFPDSWNSALFESKHLFVEVQADDTRLRETPSLDAKILTTVNTGTLLLLNDVKSAEGHTWNRVLLAPNRFAWIVRVAKVNDENSKRLTKTSKFYFTRADQYSLFVSLLGFLWGFLSYKKQRNIFS